MPRYTIIAILIMVVLCSKVLANPNSVADYSAARVSNQYKNTDVTKSDHISINKSSEITEQSFYKESINAYKDFSSALVKYISYTISFLSLIGGLFVFGFAFLFRKTINEVKQDFKEDSNEVRDIYTKTFLLLNEQAKMNMEIFKERNNEIKESLNEGKELYNNIKTAMEQISNEQSIRDQVAKMLGDTEVKKSDLETADIRSQAPDYLNALDEAERGGK